MQNGDYIKMNNGCEMVEKNLCLGCVGLAEKDWAGKHNCPIYKQLVMEEKYAKRYMGR